MENEKPPARLVRILHYRVGHEPEDKFVPYAGYESLQPLVGGMLDVVRGLHEGDENLDLWVNDEGLILGLEPNRSVELRGVAPGYQQTIVGDFFVARADEEGRTVSLTDVDIAFVKGRIR